MKATIAIAISGGIDSLAAACMLKQMQYEVVGLHFVTGFEDAGHPPHAVFPVTNDPSCANSALIDDSDIPDTIEFQAACRKMAFIAGQLGIPIKLIDCRKPFKNLVVDYFTRTYLKGFTPNPCLVCNPAVKFGYILETARKVGANRLATGHYALVSMDCDHRYHLIKGADTHKDQSYFLAFMNQRQLADACFPLGGMRKSEVKSYAAAMGLTPVSQNESQDICFIPHMHYADFILHQTGISPEPGLIEDVEGKIVGEHRGLHRFTIGQRRGINCPAAEPYYVIRLDATRNRLIVGFKTDTYTTECRIKRINWIHTIPNGVLHVDVRIRYGQKAVEAMLIPLDDHQACVRFKQPQSSITPGQGAVCYRQNEVICAGWIAF